MSISSRRQFLGGMGALGAAAAYPGAWAASATPSGLSTDEVLRLEAQATLGWLGSSAGMAFFWSFCHAF